MTKLVPAKSYLQDIVAVAMVLFLFSLYMHFFPSSLILVPAFVVAFFAFIIGNYAWEVITSPKLEIRIGNASRNGAVNVTFYNVIVKNVGRTSCKNALIKIYLKNEYNGETIEFTPKWSASPEPFTKYFFEKVPGTNDEAIQIRLNSEGLSPQLLASIFQTVSIPPMPKDDKDFVGERADLFFWDFGGSFSLRLVGESGTTLIKPPPGVKKFSPFDFYFNRASPASVLKSTNYHGVLYVVADDYCGACKINIHEWDEPDFKTAQSGDFLSASDKFHFSLHNARIRGVKPIKVVKEVLEG